MKHTHEFLEERDRKEGEFQHSLPRLTLRRFSSDPEKQFVWVFNLASRAVSCEPISKIGGNENIYDVEINGTNQSAEAILDRDFENDAGRLIGRILDNDSTQLSLKNKLKLSEFFSIQYARTKKWSNSQARQVLGVEEERRIENMRSLKPGMASTVIADENFLNIVKIQAMSVMKELIPILNAKRWVLLTTSDEFPFLMGDNPVVPWNFKAAEEGKYSILDPKTDFYIPLSSTRALMLIDENLYQLNKTKFNDDLQKEFDACIRVMTPELVESFNYIQVCRAEMLIFSKTPEFLILNTRPDMQGQLRESEFFLTRKRYDEYMDALKDILICKTIFYHFKTWNRWSTPHVNNIGLYPRFWPDAPESVLCQVRVPT